MSVSIAIYIYIYTCIYIYIRLPDGILFSDTSLWASKVPVPNCGCSTVMKHDNERCHLVRRFPIGTSIIVGDFHLPRLIAGGIYI